jgi:hypothetical protein
VNKTHFLIAKGYAIDIKITSNTLVLKFRKRAEAIAMSTNQKART